MERGSWRAWLAVARFGLAAVTAVQFLAAALATLPVAAVGEGTPPAAVA